MAKLSDTELRALLAAERAGAIASVQSSKLTTDRSDAMDYYLGDMSKDMPTIEGRSRAVSSDVADTIEGLMPSLMEIFAGGDEVVRFAPTGPEDVEPAEQESEYVNFVFTQKNPGFLVLYSFIKDALLSKVGVVKVWWEKEEREQRETYFDLPDDQFAIIAADESVEIVEHTEKPAPYPSSGAPDGAASPDGSGALHDVTVQTKKEYACAKVMGVPPEEFGISRWARNIKDSNYCFHEPPTTEGELIDQGYDPEQVRKLPDYPAFQNEEQNKRDTIDEDNQASGDDLNKTARTVKITEHYVRMDYEKNGKPRLYKVTTAGEGGEVLYKDGKPDIEPVDMMPFAAMTPVIMTHRFYGRSIADLVMDIQRIKTALLRGMLDNLYLHNNPRVEVANSHQSDDTLDDLLVSRPGGIVRTKQPGGLQWQVVPDITGAVYPALQYFDATREWRTGVTRQGQGLDADALQNQTATATNQLFNAAQARTKLIARIFAETGIRDMFSLLHATIRKHGQKAETIRYRNDWITVDPRTWANRYDMSINVGLGTGGKTERLQQIMLLIGLQKEALANGLTNLVTPDNLYNSAKEITKILELKDTEKFFVDPKTQPPPQQPPDPKLIELQVKSQLDEKALMLKAEIEKLQAQADIATQDRKTQAEIALAEKKFELDKTLKLIDAQLQQQTREQEAAVNKEQADRDHQVKMTEAQTRNAPPTIKIDATEAVQNMAPGLMEMMQQNAAMLSQAMQGLTQAAQSMERAAQTMAADSEVVRDPKTNRVVGARKVMRMN